MRSMVEGLFGAGVENVLEYTLGIRPQFRGRNSQDPIAAFAQPQVAAFVPSRVVSHFVRDAVDLDSELCCGAIEVDYIWAGWVLMAEFQVCGPGSENLPEPDFRRGHRATKGPRFCDGGFCRLPHGPSTVLRTVPLPIAFGDREDFYFAQSASLASAYSAIRRAT